MTARYASSYKGGSEAGSPPKHRGGAAAAAASLAAADADSGGGGGYGHGRALPAEARLCSLYGHERRVIALDFSHDGKLLVSVGGDAHHSAIVWDWRREQPIARCATHTSPVYAMRFNPYQASAMTCFFDMPAQWVWGGGVGHISACRGASAAATCADVTDLPPPGSCSHRAAGENKCATPSPGLRHPRRPAARRPGQ